MVGSHMLQMINFRMQETFENTEPFGGLPTILAGDLFQLQPLFDPYVFEGVKKGV